MESGKNRGRRRGERDRDLPFMLKQPADVDDRDAPGDAHRLAEVAWDKLRVTGYRKRSIRL